MAALWKLLFFSLIIRPLVLVVLGLNVRHRERLPLEGPAIVAANHNSHLDTMVLMSLFPLRMLPRLRPVAAGDYFLRNRLFAWFSTRVIGIIPIDRAGGTPRERLFDRVTEALRRGDVAIIFPEGTRGAPEQLQEFKSGLYHLSRANPGVPVTPVFLHGLGRALPRGEAALVPFFCDVFVGESLPSSGDRQAFMDRFVKSIQDLAAEGNFPAWD